MELIESLSRLTSLRPKHLYMVGGAILALIIIIIVVSVVSRNSATKASAPVPGPTRHPTNTEVDPDKQKIALGAALDAAHLGNGSVTPGSVNNTGVASKANGNMVFDSRPATVNHESPLSVNEQLKHKEFSTQVASTTGTSFLPSMTSSIKGQRAKTLTAQRAKKRQPKLEHQMRLDTVHHAGEPRLEGGIYADTLTANRVKGNRLRINPQLFGPGIVGQSPYILAGITAMTPHATVKDKYELTDKLEYSDSNVKL
jgi:hypothetical protein